MTVGGKRRELPLARRVVARLLNYWLERACRRRKRFCCGVVPGALAFMASSLFRCVAETAGCAMKQFAAGMRPVE